MNVKSIDIARALGISKSTVSLACLLYTSDAADD